MAIREISHRHSHSTLDSETTLEVRIHRRLSSLSQDTESILQLKHIRRFPAENKLRMYLEFAPHGNLRVLIDRYLRWRSVDDLFVQMEADCDMAGAIFPSPFCGTFSTNLLKLS